MRIGPVPLPPIWREGLLGLELASLMRHPLFRDPPEAPAARPVMLIPGFLTGDAQMATLGSWLRRSGHRTHRSGIRLNVDCSAASTTRLERRLEDFVRREGEPAVLIGQSRGGLFARVLAVRRPELVRAVVTLGSPLGEPVRGPPAGVDPGRSDRRPCGARRAGPRKPPLPQRRVLHRLHARPRGSAAAGHAVPVDLFEAGRDRRLGGMPRRMGGERRGAAPRIAGWRSTPRSTSCSTSRCIVRRGRTPALARRPLARAAA